MNHELAILNIVAEDPTTSQRSIAVQTGISLGQVNFLLKKFVKIGLIKIEGQTPASLSYNLTPKGMAEKADKTLRYIKASYETVRTQVAYIEKLCEKYKAKGMQIYIVGHSEEMFEICKLACDQTATPFKRGYPDQKDKAVVFCWEEDVEEKCKGFECVNVLKG